ncbi:hypothetical protein HDU77_010250 [Chytriomyces hyalinus]|nr:hypothetical protein HDU77_010250 [Chytriomyces hyalinus]
MSESVEAALANTTHVKLSGCDIDGIPRGKLVHKNKFAKSKNGLGFCNVVFAWDCHDVVYSAKHVKAADEESGYPDIIAVPDLSSFRVIPWENNIPLFLVDFMDPKTSLPLPMCPRSLLKRIVQRGIDELGVTAKCGIEYEFFNFKETPHTLAEKQGVNLTKLTPGMFGYSVTRPVLNADYFQGILNACNEMNIPLECYHTETGPGVYEVAIQYSDPVTLCDNAHLFKTVAKSIGLQHGIMPTFMAKPHMNLPGCSGHTHVSISARDLPTGNLFDPAVAGAWGLPEGQTATNDPISIEHTSHVLNWFLAGVLEAMPSMHAIFAPTINSYKRLVENYWAPITVSYGVENRTASIRLITPPTAPPSATRLEIRVPGADMNPYLTVAAILAAGYDGIARRLPLPFPPAEVQAKLEGGRSGEKRLARDLYQALEAMREEGSSARRVLGDAFVEHYVGTRLHEWRLWETAVTNWEVSRALNELNFYRKLLQLDPLASLDACDSSTAIDEPISSINCSASFETMPPEILDRIVQFVDGKSILPLCHAMPYYKYISTAMFDFAHRFPDDNYQPSMLWPDLYFPMVRNDMTKTTDFPIQHLHAAGVYSRIVSKHGGLVHVPCSKNVLNYLGALPELLSLHNGDDDSGSGRANFLRALADANKRIRSCAIGVLMQHSNVLYDEIQEALPLISGLSYLEIDVPEDISEDNSFSRAWVYGTTGS